MTLGKRIAELRKSKNFSQEYLAEKLDVSRQAVSKWEQDLSSPDTNNLIALAGVLGVSVEYLATGSTPEEKTPIPVQGKQTANVSVKQILGLIFIGVGLLSAILGIVLLWLLIAVGIFLIALGILLLKIKKGSYLLLGCITLLTVVLFVVSGLTTGLDVATVFLCIGVAFLIPLLVYAVFSLIKNHKKNRP